MDPAEIVAFAPEKLNKLPVKHCEFIAGRSAVIDTPGPTVTFNVVLHKLASVVVME